MFVPIVRASDSDVRCCAAAPARARLRSVTPLDTTTRTTVNGCGTRGKVAETWRVCLTVESLCSRGPIACVVVAFCPGNKRTNTVHSKDQEMKLGNAALLTSHNAEDWKAGLPVRVLRGHKVRCCAVIPPSAHPLIVFVGVLYNGSWMVVWPRSLLQLFPSGTTKRTVMMVCTR
jgi:hypothetical protein